MGWAFTTPIFSPCTLEKSFEHNRAVEKVDMDLELPWNELHSANRSRLGKLFVGFIAYYANFEFAQWAISIRNGRSLAANVAVQHLLFIEQAFKILVEEHYNEGNVAHTVCDEAVFGKIRRSFNRTDEVLRAQKSLKFLW
ncbi:poly(A) RNA polymerase gld 2 A [Echinococcus multilocularis]|uniref:Poly(A) RNA polymerase gld 2 A n=1 Tax=Echinococcus multilocularis TaxID=6211 RepID=A0A068XZB4_ECHMU|nr:poly(A) RNA polymerase gld 2 A [Echinococcus multilocularis]